MGVNLTALFAVISSWSVDGVRDGTQNDGSADLLEFCDARISTLNKSKLQKIPNDRCRYIPSPS
jgi:hypothetical protein